MPPEPDETRGLGSRLAARASSRRQVRQLLQAQDCGQALDELQGLPAERTLKHLHACLPSLDSSLKWRAIHALGLVVRGLAARDLEAAREFARRLLWALNEESGAMPWGVAEALGEILAQAPALAREYAGQLVCQVWPEGSLAEFKPLQRGAVWALGRLAQAQPDLLRGQRAMELLLPLLDSPDAGVRGLAAWALGWLGARQAWDKLAQMGQDAGPVELGQDGETVQTTVAALAAQALSRV